MARTGCDLHGLTSEADAVWSYHTIRKSPGLQSPSLVIHLKQCSGCDDSILGIKVHCTALHSVPLGLSAFKRGVNMRR